MLKTLNSYINYIDIYNDLTEAWKEQRWIIIKDDITETIINEIRDFFECDINELNLLECEFDGECVILEKGINFGANESDSVGSYYRYWIKYSFNDELIIDGGYEQG